MSLLENRGFRYFINQNKVKGVPFYFDVQMDQKGF